MSLVPSQMRPHWRCHRFARSELTHSGTGQCKMNLNVRILVCGSCLVIKPLLAKNAFTVS